MAANFTSYTVALRGTGSGIQPGIRATAALFNGTTVVGLVHCDRVANQTTT